MRGRSGAAGSLVRSGTRNSWAPPIPACIVNSSHNAVELPGLMVVCPTTALGGQQPLRTLTGGTSVRRRRPSPALVRVNTARAGASKGR